MIWTKFKNKNVFIQLNSGTIYTAYVKDVDDTKPPLVWIEIIDKFGDDITIVHSEIKIIKILKNVKPINEEGRIVRGDKEW